jgi:hypothetical protein
VFIFWDKLFGTFTPETEKVKYGLTKPIKEIGPLTLVTHEWKRLADDLRQSSNWKDKWWHIVGPPDGGSRKKYKE